MFPVPIPSNVPSSDSKHGLAPGLRGDLPRVAVSTDGNVRETALYSMMCTFVNRIGSPRWPAWGKNIKKAR
jgi:hypothetical protein